MCIAHQCRQRCLASAKAIPKPLAASMAPAGQHDGDLSTSIHESARSFLAQRHGTGRHRAAPHTAQDACARSRPSRFIPPHPGHGYVKDETPCRRDDVGTGRKALRPKRTPRLRSRIRARDPVVPPFFPRVASPNSKADRLLVQQHGSTGVPLTLVNHQTKVSATPSCNGSCPWLLLQLFLASTRSGWKQQGAYHDHFRP